MKRIIMCMLVGILALSLVGGAALASGFDAASEIVVVSREDGSGTRGAFIELMGIEVKDDAGNKTDRTYEEATIVNSTSVVMTTVAGNPYAIGYISLGSLNETIKAVKVNDVVPSAETVKDGTYPISRPFNIATKGEVGEIAQDFINFIMSAEGQTVVNGNGYITVNDAAESYAAAGLSGKITVAGSSSVTPVMEKLKEAYVALNPNVTIEIQMSDSSTGMSNAIEGVADIGMASRALKDSELEAGLTPTAIAMDGIAMVTNLENPIENLTAEQIMGIYIGEITSWDALAQ